MTRHPCRELVTDVVQVVNPDDEVKAVPAGGAMRSAR